GLRQALLGRWRRRRYLLAHTTNGLDHRVRAGALSLAPPAKCSQRLLQATARLCTSRSSARRKMAGQVQQRRPFDVARTPLWEGRGGDSVSTRQDLPWNMGECPVPVDLRARSRLLVVPDADAGMVLPAAEPCRPDGARGLLAAIAGVEPSAPGRRIADADPGGAWRASRPVRSGAALQAPPYRSAGARGRLPPGPAGGPSAGTCSTWSRPLGLERSDERHPAARRAIAVERTVGGYRNASHQPQADPRAIGYRAGDRRRFRSLGSLHTRRPVWPDPRRGNGGRARQWASAVPVSQLAEGAASRRRDPACPHDLGRPRRSR